MLMLKVPASSCTDIQVLMRSTSGTSPRSRRDSREASSPPSTIASSCKASTSASPYGAAFQTLLMRVCATRSCSTYRVERCRGAGIGGSLARLADAGMWPKYFGTSRLAVARSISPASTRMALFGPYQRWNQALTSASDAASRSFIEPIALCW